MPSKHYFSYIRVSTLRQGQTGTSLSEQQAAIERHANRFGLNIVKAFEEKETAAKQGRPIFLEMLKALRHGKADGVLIHKIDRSARNLKDWADLGSLIDSGIDVHFVNESLDLNSRGGRLSADIQAVVAADYIRNLREETKKGIYGRLKQGLFPFRAVTGYLDAGRGQSKQLDPIQAPLVRQAFELYATGEWGLNALVEEMHKRGLRNRNGKKVTRNGLTTIFRNPFYIGLISVKITNEMFVGQHPPLIPKTLFDNVQEVLSGKNVKKKKRHFFIFRRHILCDSCGNKRIAELQKGNVYYRCQTKNCSETTIREDCVERQLLNVFEKFKFNEIENRYLRLEIKKQDAEETNSGADRRKQILFQLDNIKERLSKYADAFVDEMLDRETYLEKKSKLIMEQRELEESLRRSEHYDGKAIERAEQFLELINNACLSYKLASLEERRDLIQTVTSNFSAKGKLVSIKLNYPFQLVAERQRCTAGSPDRAATRTFRLLVQKLVQWFKENSIPKRPDISNDINASDSIV